LAAELSMYSGEIKKNGLAGNFYTKEDFLNPDELKGDHSTVDPTDFPLCC